MAQKIEISPELIGGDVDEGYGKVADAFRRNLTSGREVGAAVAVFRDGRKVVDLWGGLRDANTRAPWSAARSSPCSRPRKAFPRLPRQPLPRVG
jgi:hypothetical protein